MQPSIMPIFKLAPVYLFMLLGLSLSGCGEFAYKRGASASDLESTKKLCASKSADSASLDKCLEDHGWVMQRFNENDNMADEPLLAEASVSNDNRNPVPAKTAQAKAGPTTATGKAADTLPLEPGQAAPVSAPAKKPADPLDTFKVSSWWKLGNGGESMKTAMNECVTSLGEAHRYNETTQMATRGLIVCMGGKGWRGLRAK